MRAHAQNSYASSEPSFDLGAYIEILKRRVLLITIPFVLVFSVGFAIAILLPPIYLSQGRILVESQQIPTELVRPTVTGSARERIQVIEQRVFSRENLLAVAEKFEVFGDKRQGLSGTEIFDRMRARARMEPFELDPTRRRENLTIAVTISFEHERPDIATRVANELVTLVLREDARNRTNRATETTRFLAREVRKHEEDLSRIDTQISEFKRRQIEAVPERLMAQLITLKAELATKASIFSEKHPDLARLKQQIEALEKLTARTKEFDSTLEALQGQRAQIQITLDATSQKLSAARLGESLERDQFSERLEVLEQAVMPQRPIKPNRLKLLAAAFAAAAMAGLGCVFVAESLDKSIRRKKDLLSFVDGAMVVTIPYIATKRDLARKRIRLALLVGSSVAVVAIGLVATHLTLRPLDQLWTALVTRLLG